MCFLGMFRIFAFSLNGKRYEETKRSTHPKYGVACTSSARPRSRSALSRRSRTSELLLNYLFKVNMLFMSH